MLSPDLNARAAVPPPLTNLKSPPPPEEDAGLLDYALLRDWLTFVLRAPRRHRLLTVAAFLFVLAATAVFLWGFPKTYQVQTRILAQRNQVMGTISNPSIFRQAEDMDAPTRAARETVLRWDNLVALVEQTQLVDTYLANRAPVVRLRDRVVRLFKGRDRTREELTEALAQGLEKRMKVWVENGLVTISVDWSDAPTAFRLATAAMQRFIEVRHASELAIIGDAVSVLDTHTAAVQHEIDAALEQLVALERELAPAPRTARHSTTGVVRSSPGDDNDVVRLRSQLASKQRAISDLEDFRQRRLSELQEQLVGQQAIYSSLHPVILSLKQTIAALEKPSAQVENLRNETQSLEREIARTSAAAAERAVTNRTATQEPEPVAVARSNDPDDEDPRLTNARGRLRALYTKYWGLRDRADAAHLELDTAQEAFKYRYSVMQPPQMPKGPIKPKPPLVAVAGVLGGICFALFAGCAVDLRSGVVAEGWQITRRVGIPLLAELRR